MTTPTQPQLPEEVKRILETHIGTARPGERLLVEHLCTALTPYLAPRSPAASTLDDPRRQPVESGPATAHANPGYLAPRQDAEWAELTLTKWEHEKLGEIMVAATVTEGSPMIRGRVRNLKDKLCQLPHE